MNITEYKRIEELDYSQYCNYLQDKYGIGVCDYLTSTWNIKKQCKRTKEGLYAHHKYEDHASKLAEPKIAKNYPFEWQTAKNIVYCDYLEHLLLHILIFETKFENAVNDEPLGIGGIIQYMVPELNDVYSGWKTAQDWRAICHNKIINDKDVYLLLIKRLLTNVDFYDFCEVKDLLSSCNANFVSWDRNNNQELFLEILASYE